MPSSEALASALGGEVWHLINYMFAFGFVEILRRRSSRRDVGSRRRRTLTRTRTRRTGEGSPSPFRERPSEEAGVRAEAQGGFRADVRDPGSWHRFAPGEVKAQWRRLLREAGVGGGAQEREVAFLALLADRMADLLKETRTPAALSCAEAVAARLTTHQLAVQKGWGRAAAFSDAMLGPLLLSEGTGAEGDREDVPAFMRSAMQAAASVPAASSRSAAGRWAAGAVPIEALMVRPRFVVHPDVRHVETARGILARALSGGYWDRMGSVYAQLAAYRNACGQPPSWATTVVLYVAAQMDRGLLPSTLLNYTNTAVSALRRVGVEVASDVLIVDLRRALGKMGARRPTREAVPITAGDFWAAVEAEADEKVSLRREAARLRAGIRRWLAGGVEAWYDDEPAPSESSVYSSTASLPGCKVPAARAASGLPLADVTRNRVDLRALGRMDVVGRFREVLPMLEDVGAFESRLKAGCEAGFEAVSRDMERHRNSMKAFGVADDAQVPPLFVMRAFTTPKKDGKTSRLVVDARPINAAMDRPPPMDLPRMQELIAEVKRHRYAMQCDLSSAHINLKEMWALAEGVTQMCWTPGTTTCRVDNAEV
ncbi:hypothetical protein DIPPA_22630, partial [Diplonema papillatum]